MPNPIQSKKELIARILEIHFDCYKLCRDILNKYFDNAGNMGVFCHDEEEYKFLTKLREAMTEPSANPKQKYFKLIEPITVLAHEDIPEITYSHLYIRKPDNTPYGKYFGDVDFFLDQDEYEELKSIVISGKKFVGAQIYNRPGWDMIQLSKPTIKSVAFISTKEMTEKIRVKFD
jgi:hypothetical protein